MKSFLLLSVLGLTALNAQAQTTVAAPDMQIKWALMAAPADMRDGAMVYGYNKDRAFTVLRKGTNNLVCLTDDPSKKGFSVSCYHRDLEPFMARGRALQKEGKSSADVMKTREEETKAGKLKMPEKPATLYVFSAKDENVNMGSGEVTDGYLRYVVYIPYATTESTGLPLKPDAPGMPWLMDPGTHRAHIMINPPTKE